MLCNYVIIWQPGGSKLWTFCSFLPFPGLLVIFQYVRFCDVKNCSATCPIIINLNNSKTRSQLYFENLFQNKDMDWKHIYLFPRWVTVDTNLRIYQYKILNNVLYLNEKLFRFRKISWPLCSVCQSENETPITLFHRCIRTNLLRYKLKKFLKIKTDLPVNTVF